MRFRNVFQEYHNYRQTKTFTNTTGPLDNIFPTMRELSNTKIRCSLESSSGPGSSGSNMYANE